MKMEDTACLALAIKDEDVKEEEGLKEEVVVEESKKGAPVGVGFISARGFAQKNNKPQQGGGNCLRLL